VLKGLLFPDSYRQTRFWLEIGIRAEKPASGLLIPLASGSDYFWIADNPGTISPCDLGAR